jgi:long-chain acyl-CoA synthetase
LAVLAEEAFERHGNYPSLFFEGTWFRSGELFERSRRLGAGLVELGISPGDRVIVLMWNGPDVGIAYIALWRSGAVVTPVIFLTTPAELHRILKDSGARAVLTSGEFLPSVAAAAAGVDSVRWVVVAEPEPPVSEAGEGAGIRAVPLRELEAAAPGRIVPRGNDDLAAVLYTGGTTGRAKGVMLTHENLWLCARSSNEATFTEGVRRAIVPLPLSHAFGLITTIVAMHNAEPPEGVLMRWFEPLTWLRLVQEHRVQRGAVVPTMIQALLDSRLEDFDLSSLRYINVGAAPLAVDAVRRFERRVPTVEICEGYGCTEAGGVISVNPVGARRLGSVGTPIPGCEVRIADEEDRDVPAGGAGEVCCRSSGVMPGYWNGPEASAEALRGGWLRTGDIGRMDDDGYLWIIDRKKDLIIRGGFNVFPRDVEDVLLEHPAVSAAGVVGMSDHRLGEEVVAFVSLRPGSDPLPSGADLVEFCKGRLAANRYPREVRIVPAVPLSPLGKVDRRALRELL